MTNGFSGVRAKAIAVFVALASFLFSTEVWAVLGQAKNWQLGFQEAATPIMRQLTNFHDFLLVLCAVVTLFVMGLLFYVAWRFNEKANPEPSTTSHHTVLEVLWTVLPILILVVIAVPSFRLLFAQYDFPKADVTVKAIGNQWYWSYEYPDHDNMTFDAYRLHLS